MSSERELESSKAAAGVDAVYQRCWLQQMRQYTVPNHYSLR